MTTLLSNQDKTKSLTNTNQCQKLALTIVMAITLSACGGGDTADKIIDNTDTNRSTSVSYINSLDNNTTFFLQSAIYSASVYESQFQTIELMSAQASEEIQHDWIKGANESVFAIENSMTNGSRVSQNININEDTSYWAVAWSNTGESKLAVFEKKANNKADMYSVRLLASSAMAVKNSYTNEDLTTTEPGIVTTSFEVEGCLDLLVGDNEIDLCSIGTVGNSYLAVVSIDGQVVVAQE
jgi:hypothetical protein